MPLKVKNKNVAELIDKFLEIESDFPDHPARFLDRRRIPPARVLRWDEKVDPRSRMALSYR